MQIQDNKRTPKKKKKKKTGGEREYPLKHMHTLPVRKLIDTPSGNDLCWYCNHHRHRFRQGTFTALQQSARLAPRSGVNHVVKNNETGCKNSKYLFVPMLTVRSIRTYLLRRQCPPQTYAHLKKGTNQPYMAHVRVRLLPPHL